MKFSKIFSILFGALLVCTLAQAQKGTIKGTVFDDATAELLPFLNVVIEGTTIGTSTDLDGAYTLNVEPGTYVLVFSYLGYADKKVTDITIAADEIKVVDVKMGGSSETLQEIVITERAERNTENAVLSLIKKSSGVLDGISAQSFNKVGDSDAAAAIKRVTGVSVQDGKYIFVRGLGDRYTKTLLNGNEIPGLDPDRNNVQMDIFPANLIDRIIVKKTFTPNLPGDFTGGIVDITTKDFPDSLSYSLSYSTSYNPQTHFNDDFILYKGGKTDWLGFDDGTRGLPFEKRTPVPNEVRNDQTLADLTAAFNPTMAATPKTNFLNQSLAFGFGNQINKENIDIGFNLALNYGLNYQYYPEVVNAEYIKDPDESGVFDLQTQRKSLVRIGEQDASWSGLFGTSIKIKKTNKLRFNIFHSQNGNAKASDGMTENGPENPASKLNHALFYTERGITNLGLSGNHSINNIKFSWRTSATKSSIEDPDLRISDLNCDLDNGDCEVGRYQIEGAVGAKMRRDFRDLSERNYTGGVDLEIPFTLKNKNKTKLQFGFLETYKERDFDIQSFVVNNNVRPPIFDFEPNWFFQSENIWDLEDKRGTYIIYSDKPSNTFNARQNVLAGYLMNEMPIGQKLKLIYGLRAEYFTTHFTGNNPGSPPMSPLDYEDSLVYETLNILPAFNMVYNLKDNMNFRAAYSQTVARPSFKEKSTISIYDPISDRRFTGNLDSLVSTNIHNADLRWEYFFNGGEIISFGAFYKYFINPIELVVKDVTSPGEITPLNAPTATILGAELEFRKNFGFINENLRGLSIGTNLTYVNAAVKMRDEEFKDRVAFALEGETIERTRSFFGQSPYIINAYINYEHPTIGLNTNLSYNVQGERLAVVGAGGIPDVFEQPVNSLNFKISQPIINKLGTINFSVDNILDAQNQQIYKSELAVPEVYNSFLRGRTYGLGFSFNF